jgi:hypothetical protein
VRIPHLLAALPQQLPMPRNASRIPNWPPPPSNTPASSEPTDRQRYHPRQLRPPHIDTAHMLPVVRIPLLPILIRCPTDSMCHDRSPTPRLATNLHHDGTRSRAFTNLPHSLNNQKNPNNPSAHSKNPNSSIHPNNSRPKQLLETPRDTEGE